MKRFGTVSALILLFLLLPIEAAFSLDLNRRVNLDVKKAPFPEAIRRIFAGSKDKFWVDPALKNLKVTASLKNVTREQAITVVVRTAGVVYLVEKNVHTFRPYANVSQRRTTSAPAEGPTRVTVFSLHYISAGEAAAMLNACAPDGLESITASNANTMFVKGSAEAVAQVAKLIEMFDRESALPRPVRVVLSLTFTIPDQQSPTTLKTESLGPEGLPMPLTIDFGNRGNDTYVVDAKLTPNVLTDGSVSLTGSGRIDCSLFANHVAKSFEVAASVTPGTPVVVASGSFQNGETYKVDFAATVTATVEKGRIVLPKNGLTTASAAPLYVPRKSRPMTGEPSKTHRRAADDILQQIWDAKPGQGKFDAMDVVVRKYKESDLATRNAIVWLCLDYMNDIQRGVIDRWPCEYILQRVRYEPAMPQLIDILANDPVEAMRAVAAEALGMWYKGTSNNDILDALKQSQRTETSQWVQDTLAKYLGNKPN